MGQVSGCLRVLSSAEMQLVHDAAVDILEKVGMRIEHKGALDYLKAYGCDVNPWTQVVKFPRAVMEDPWTRCAKITLDLVL